MFKNQNPNDVDLKKVIEIILESTKESLAELELSRESIVKILQKESELSTIVKSFIFSKLKTMSAVGEFSDEEQVSNMGYPNYKYKNLIDQKDILQKYFGDLGSIDSVYVEKKIPDHSNFFLIPEMDIVGANMEHAMNNILEILASIYGKPIYNSFVTRKLSYEKLKTERKTLEAINAIRSEQDGEKTIILPAQMGIKHRGRSSRRSIECMKHNEFGLTPYHIGIVLITHPERLMDKETDLSLLCTGSIDDQKRNPIFTFGYNSIDYNLFWNSLYSQNFSSATGFVL